MHIKQVVLAGFKSYRDEVALCDIDPGLNVIVGKNGTGKSNIFNAIRYVLADGDISNLRNSVGAERGQECFVELIFDNTDRRFLTMGDEVSIKRSLDTQNDFWMNGKKTPQKDVMNYLESAGFGRYNPFYVVPQGKVASLINATDEERLQLLLTASGLDLFERKKKESQRSINKSLKDIDNIEVSLDEINDRLATLQEEIGVSDEYNAAEFEQRRLKFEQLKREQALVESVLSTCTTKLAKLRETEVQVDSDLNEAHETQQANEAKISELKCIIDTIGAQLEYQQRSAIDDLDTVQAFEYDELIATATAQIAAKTKDLNDFKDKLAANEAKFSEVSSQLRALQLKHAQSSRFDSKQARDSWIEGEIAKTIEEIEADKLALAKVTKEVEATDLPMVPTDAIDELSDELERGKAAVHEEQKKLAEVQTQLKSAQLERRKNEILAESLDEQASAIVEKANDSLVAEVAAAIEQAKECAKDLGVEDKFYGPLANLMKLDDTYTTATEAIAKSALFYCVVEDTETVKAIAKELVARKAGRLSFIPLQQINAKPAIELSEADTEEVAALSDLIECDDKFRPAVDLIIGSALLCADLDASWRCSRAYNVDCVTLEGSIVSPHGALRGGSRKSRGVSRFAALASIGDIFSRKAEAHAKVFESTCEIDKSQQLITNAHNMVHQAKQKVSAIFARLDEARREYSRATHEVKVVTQTYEAKKQQAERLSALIDNLNSVKEGLEADLQTDFGEPLSAEEVNIMGELSRESAELQKAKVGYEAGLASTKRALDEAKAQKWDAELAKERSFDDSQVEQPANNNESAETLEKKRTDAVEKHAALRLEMSDAVAGITEMGAVLYRTKKEIKKQEFREEKYRDLLKDSKRQMRQLGLTESDELTDLSDAQLEEKLQDVQSRLNRCGPINQFAQEQYSKYKHEFSEESSNRDKIAKELEESQKMIAQLDAYKSKAILNTFKEVEKRFSKFFNHLTRTDTAKLHVEGNDPLKWKGLEITVSFARHRQLRIEQLSGGQKALCALAFLLSLQASDPAPFYIFDEVDASLDAQYRGTLADTIKQISGQLKAQFICTTFSPELVRIADCVYGTAFTNNTSTIGVIDKDLALSLVDVSGQDVASVLG